MRPWECPQTDTHTHVQTQNDFIICPMLYAIAMGQIIKHVHRFADQYAGHPATPRGPLPVIGNSNQWRAAYVPWMHAIQRNIWNTFLARRRTTLQRHKTCTKKNNHPHIATVTGLRCRCDEYKRLSGRRERPRDAPYQLKLDGKYSERVQLPANATANCQHNGGARFMEQPFPQCWSTNHVSSWICILGRFTG